MGANFNNITLYNNVNYQINVTSYYLSFEWDKSEICSCNRFGVISQNIKTPKQGWNYTKLFLDYTIIC